MGDEKGALHGETLRSANEGKFSSDRPPDNPKTMTRPPPRVEGLSLLVTSYNGASSFWIRPLC